MMKSMWFGLLIWSSYVFVWFVGLLLKHNILYTNNSLSIDSYLFLFGAHYWR